MIDRSSIRDSARPEVANEKHEFEPVSIKSDVDGERFNSAVAPTESIQQDGLNRSQVSHDTLMMSKQVSAMSPKKRGDVYAGHKEGDEKYSPGRTDFGWQASLRDDSEINLDRSSQPFGQTSQPSILNNPVLIGIDAGEQTTTLDVVSQAPIDRARLNSLKRRKEQELFAEH